MSKDKKTKSAGIKIKNGVILGAMTHLKKLLAEKFPVKTALALVALVKALEKPYAIIEEVRRGLILKYGDKSAAGRIEIIPPDNPDGKPASPNWEAFAKEYNELANEETAVIFDKVKLPQTVSVKCAHCGRMTEKPLEIEGDALLALETFIVVEQSKTPTVPQPGRPYGRP